MYKITRRCALYRCTLAGRRSHVGSYFQRWCGSPWALRTRKPPRGSVPEVPFESSPSLGHSLWCTGCQRRQVEFWSSSWELRGSSQLDWEMRVGRKEFHGQLRVDIFYAPVDGINTDIRFKWGAVRKRRWNLGAARRLGKDE